MRAWFAGRELSCSLLPDFAHSPPELANSRAKNNLAAEQIE
jgi:hypothetical protein